MDKHMPTRALARLTPPPGGEQRLRAALVAKTPSHRGWALPLAASLGCICVLAGVLALRPDPVDDRIREAVETAMTPPAGGIRVSGAQVEKVGSPDPDVRIYRLAAAPTR